MANRPITPKEKQAWIFAKNAHKGQVRKFINKPYFNAHVQKVNGIVKQYTTDEDLLCAALLHDVVEDCYDDTEVGLAEIKEVFGERISEIVRELTSLDDEIEHHYYGSKTNYLIDKMLNMTDDALIVKLADRLQNISDAFTASEKFRNNYFNQTSEIMTHLQENRKFNKVQGLLANEINAKINNISSIFKIKKFREF